MFGFSFGELVMLVIVAIVVIGPKDLPRVLRKVGQWSGKIRRMAADMRSQSGIDDVLRGEGLGESIQEIRKLARGELGDIQKSIRYDGVEAKVEAKAVEVRALRDREYPRDGVDTYGALPDNAVVYEGTLPKSALYQDALYRMGDKSAVIPEDPKEEEHADESDHAEVNGDAQNVDVAVNARVDADVSANAEENVDASASSEESAAEEPVARTGSA